MPRIKHKLLKRLTTFHTDFMEWSPVLEGTAAEELMLLNCGVGEDSWESLGLQGDPTSPS